MALLLAVTWLDAATPNSTLNFTLDEPCKTSAGIFLPDGTLVRTLWSKVRYSSGGTYSATWDGLDDAGNSAPQGVYQVKLLQHNTEYVWDGAIGNTSADPSGPSVHRGFYFIQDMAIAGTNAFYVSGYNEGQFGFRGFSTSDPQRVSKAWFWDLAPSGQLTSSPGIADRDWAQTTTDGSWIYFACPATYNSTNQSANGNPGCVVATQLGSFTSASFTEGVMIPNTFGHSFPNGIYVGTQPGLSGLSVQQNGNLLAVAVNPDNRVYLLDKRSGAALASLPINSPRRLNFSPNGSLWIISGGTVVCYTNLLTNPSVTTSITTLSEPLAVAVDPTNSDLVLIADGGTSQQVKAFNSAGASAWTYGLPGGYQVNGPAVATNKFWFSYEGVSQTFLCFSNDGSFWVGDEENHRVMHFSGSRTYLEQIMYQPHSYKVAVDKNNPTRVFNQFLEFKVDYTKPLAEAWTLENNWKANVPAKYTPWNQGLHEVTTFPNGRTYALIDNTSIQFSPGELCELTTNQLRISGIVPMLSSGNSWVSFGPSGSVRRIPKGSAKWFEAPLTGFDAANNPIWGAEALLASASEQVSDPVPRCCSGEIHTAISSNNVVISYDSTLNNGWHFGGIQLGTAAWLWKAGPSLNLNGCGNYEIGNGLTYAGNEVMALDRHVVFGYHGEFYRGQGQASQHMHFLDDGLFVGQFGEASPGHSISEGTIPGFAGGGISPNFVKTTSGDYYIWVNDEAAHGPQRWHFVNARNLREQIGNGPMGSPISLTSPPSGFPTRVLGKSGPNSGKLTWLPVAGATSYNVLCSRINGGPYGTFVGSAISTNYLALGLNNGQIYYFVVAAVVANKEGIPSEQVEIAPFDTSQAVLGAGTMAEGGAWTPTIDVNSSALASSRPSFIGSEHFTAVLNPLELNYYGYGGLVNKSIGSKGYVLFNWQGAGSHLTNLSSSFTMTRDSGWADIPFLGRQYKVDGVLGTNWGLSANPVGTINIGVNDNNFHFLTVVSPPKFSDARNYVISALSTNGGRAQYSVAESAGFSHLFQFLFRGNISLQADATGGNLAVVQAIFLDDASFFGVLPPSELHLLPATP